MQGNYDDINDAITLPIDFMKELTRYESIQSFENVLRGMVLTQ